MLATLLLWLVAGSARADHCFPLTCTATPTGSPTATPTVSGTQTATLTNSGTATATNTAVATAIAMRTQVSSYRGVASAGVGVPFIVASGNLTGRTSNVASVCSFTPGTAGTFRVNGFVDVTAWTTPATFNLQVSYTDDNAVSRTANMPVEQLTGVFAAAITATGVWEAASLTFNANAAAITVLTAGTFTGSPTYNVYGSIEQLR